MDDSRIRHYSSGNAAWQAAGEMHGLQLWANLPASQKMTTPRYQDIKSNEITELHDDDDNRIRIIAGNYRGYQGRLMASPPNPNISTSPAP